MNIRALLFGIVIILLLNQSLIVADEPKRHRAPLIEPDNPDDWTGDYLVAVRQPNSEEDLPPNAETWAAHKAWLQETLKQDHALGFNSTVTRYISDFIVVGVFSDWMLDKLRDRPEVKLVYKEVLMHREDRLPEEL